LKTKGILNPELSKLVAEMGHGDILLIADRGIPFPQHTRTTCIDLSVSRNLPMVADVLKVVLEELEVESVIISNETKQVSPQVYKNFKDILAKKKNKGKDIAEDNIPHIDFKNLFLTGKTVDEKAIDLVGREVKGIVRTGEFTPFAYIMLVAGVDF
jgi:D-ribose pyranase